MSLRSVIRQQNAQIHGLQTAIRAQSQKQGHAAQVECAASAQKLLSSRGWKPEDGSEYENHFNARLSKCFVLISTYLLKDDFRSIDLYDAVEGRHYAAYNGHNICDVLITGKPKKCMIDGGSIWFDGNDSRHPSDFNVGFRGLCNLLRQIPRCPKRQPTPCWYCKLSTANAID
jgi:hypothetical protein